MTTWSLIVIALVLCGVAWVWYRINTDKSGAISCCGCGQCAVSGECTMVKKKAKKDTPYLTNQTKKI